MTPSSNPKVDALLSFVALAVFTYGWVRGREERRKERLVVQLALWDVRTVALMHAIGSASNAIARASEAFAKMLPHLLFSGGAWRV